jgi:hypothetical protein
MSCSYILLKHQMIYRVSLMIHPVSECFEIGYLPGQICVKFKYGYSSSIATTIERNITVQYTYLAHV